MILVTGASGFVGQHLCQRLLQQGEPIRALYFRTPPPPFLKNMPGIEWVSGDLLDVIAVEDMMDGIRQVYHLAGKVSFHPQDQQKLWEGNLIATQNLVNECIERKIDKLLFLSSVSALGKKGTKEERVDESVEWEESGHNSYYGKSKHLAEFEVWRGIAEGLEAVILNPATILGEGDWNQGSCRLVKLAYDQFPFYTEGVTGWVDVIDVVEASILAMNSSVHSERFILAEGNYPYRHIFSRLAQHMNRRPAKWKAGPWISALAWRWNALRRRAGSQHTSLSRETATMAQRKIHFDARKFQERFPAFQYTPMESTLDRVANAYLERVKRSGPKN